MSSLIVSHSPEDCHINIFCFIFQFVPSHTPVIQSSESLDFVTWEVGRKTPAVLCLNTGSQFCRLYFIKHVTMILRTNNYQSLCARNITRHAKVLNNKVFLDIFLELRCAYYSLLGFFFAPICDWCFVLFQIINITMKHSRWRPLSTPQTSFRAALQVRRYFCSLKKQNKGIDHPPQKITIFYSPSCLSSRWKIQ